MVENTAKSCIVLFNMNRKEFTSLAKTFSAIKGNLYMIWKIFHLPLTPSFLHLIFLSPSKIFWSHTVSGFESIINFMGEGSLKNMLGCVIVMSFLLILTSDESWVCSPSSDPLQLLNHSHEKQLHPRHKSGCDNTSEESMNKHLLRFLGVTAIFEPFLLYVETHPIWLNSYITHSKILEPLSNLGIFHSG